MKPAQPKPGLWVQAGHGTSLWIRIGNSRIRIYVLPVHEFRLIKMASNDFSFIIKPSTRTHTLHSTTFTPLSQDRLLLVSEIFHHHYLNSPNHPIFKYEDSPGVVKTIYWSDWYLAIHRAGRYVREIFRFSDPNERPVIAMLANTGVCSMWQLWFCLF